MKIEFSKEEIGQLAAVLVGMYNLRDSLEDAKDVIEIAAMLADAMRRKIGISVKHRYIYTLTFNGKDGEQIGVISIQGGKYVYEFE